MILAQKLNDVSTLINTADRLGVTLPADFDAQGRHLLALDSEMRTATRPDPARSAVEVATHLGQPAALAKALAKASTDLATAEASLRLRAALIDRCSSLVGQRMRTDADAIASAFAPAVTNALAVLNAEAVTLPRGFKPEHASSLNPTTFAAWVAARDAHAFVESLHLALRSLYNVPADGLLAPDAVRALRYVQPPELVYPQATAFARALAGVQHGGSNVGPVNVDGVFMPTAVAHLGGTFAWANPSEVASRAAQLKEATVPSVAQRGAALLVS